MTRPDSTFDEVQLRGGCALGCVALSMLLALSALTLVGMLALALGVGQTIAAIVPPADRPAIADHLRSAAPRAPAGLTNRHVGRPFVDGRPEALP